MTLQTQTNDSALNSSEPHGKSRKHRRKCPVFNEDGTPQWIGHWYKVLEELPISDLFTDPQWAIHNRLRVFVAKGLVCVRCGKVGSRLLIGRDKGGRIHEDIYTEDLQLMTVDHILPRSKEGSNDLENLQPMCERCNNKKGNRSEEEDIARVQKNQEKYQPKRKMVG